MKRNFFLLIFAFLLVTGVVGCVADVNDEPSNPGQEVSANVGLSGFTARPVALEDALSEMYSLMDDINPGTRASRTIGSVELLGGRELNGMGGSSGPATRSGVQFPDSLLYLVNFDEGGFAVLSADASLASVLALTTAGQIAGSNFVPNPNIGFGPSLEELWVEEDQDYLLGGVGPEDAGNFVGNMLMSYVINTISLSVPETNPPGGLGGMDQEEDHDVDPPGNTGPGNGGVTYSYVYEWVMDYNKPELLTTTWHQNAPFNDFVELLRLPGTLAGCVAIATMQIMAYHEKPLSVQDLFYDNGDPCLMDEINPFMVPETDTVTWAGLKEFALQGGPDTISIRPAAASVALHIGQGCNMKYNFNGNESFSWPNSAKRYLISQGYDATRYISYKESKIISEVKADRPVFVGALGDFAHGHAWVIDGYMERHERKIRVGSDGSRSIEKENVRSQQLVHCNWGWGGSCDGYYDSRSFFSPGDGNQIPDNGAGSSSAYYSWCFRTVTVKP